MFAWSLDDKSMKNNLRIVILTIGPFLLGLGYGRMFGAEWIEAYLPWCFFLFLFFVGTDIGALEIRSFFKTGLKTSLLLSALTITGSFLGGMLLSIILSSVQWSQGLFVSAGLGYYSIASALVAAHHEVWLASIVLLSNVFRELGTILFAPLIQRYFGSFGLIASSGACALDSCLPSIRAVGGANILTQAVLTGGILTILVPFLISFLFIVGH